MLIRTFLTNDVDSEVGKYGDFFEAIVDRRYDAIIDFLAEYRAAEAMKRDTLPSDFDAHATLLELKAAVDAVVRSGAPYATQKANTLSTLLLTHIPVPEESRATLRDLRSNQLWQPLIEKLDDAVAVLPRVRFDEEVYRSSLVETEVLISELIDVLRIEYNRRISETRKRLDVFVLPHQQTICDLQANLEVIENNLVRLHSDQNLTDDDKSELEAAFTGKRAEIKELLKNEESRVEQMRFVLATMEEEFGSFRRLIEQLEQLRKQHANRASYTSALKKLGADIPGLASALDRLYEHFTSSLGSLKSSFALFDQRLQVALIDAIENQTFVNKFNEIPNQLRFAAGNEPGESEFSGGVVPARLSVSTGFLEEMDGTGD